MTDHVHRLRARLANAGLQKPAVLLGRWQRGEMSLAALRELIPEVWLYAEWPETDIGQLAWLQMFEAAGFLSYPGGSFQPPTSSQVAYRGATPDRARGIAWAQTIETARMYAKRRHLMGGRARLYEGTVPPELVLAVFQRSDDRRVEFLVDPRSLALREVVDDPSRT